MKPSDVLRIYEGADAAGYLEDKMLVSLHLGIINTYLAPAMAGFWSSKMGPAETAAKLQQAADKAMPLLLARWIRNVKFTGVGQGK